MFCFDFQFLFCSFGKYFCETEIERMISVGREEKGTWEELGKEKNIAFKLF